MSVRTTVTLEEDVLERVKERSRADGKSFKDTLNDLLRLALITKPEGDRSKFVVKATPFGLRPGLSYDNLEELLEWAEGPDHR